MKNNLYFLLFISSFTLCMEIEKECNPDYEVEFTLFAGNPIRNASSFSPTELNKYSNAYKREIMPEETFLPVALQVADCKSNIELADIKPPLFIPEKEVFDLNEGSVIFVKNKDNKVIKMIVNTDLFISENQSNIKKLSQEMLNPEYNEQCFTAWEENSDI